MVPKHPPPNFLAPYPANNPLKILFMILIFLINNLLIFINLKLNIYSRFIVIRIVQKVSEFTAKKKHQL